MTGGRFRKGEGTGFFGRRPKNHPGQGDGASWVITFADMVTLLLTFLVLIIGITNMEPRTPFTFSEGTLKEEEHFVRLGDGALLFSDRSLLAPVIELAENLPRLPENIQLDQEEIKRAIFQLDPAQTPDFEKLRDAADEGVSVSKDGRGLVIQWDRNLLFPEGGTILYEENLPLLQKMAVFLLNLEMPVSIEAHTNPLSSLEGGTGPESYDLSMRRAKVVMEYLVSLGLAEKRFRLGGHGGGSPRTTDPELAWENSRLEIIIYRPDRSSPFGG